jgi:hypothetical protein
VTVLPTLLVTVVVALAAVEVIDQLSLDRTTVAAPSQRM